ASRRYATARISISRSRVISGSALPLSPLVAIRNVISAPCAAQRAKVAPAKNSGSSGCAKTPSTRLKPLALFVSFIVLILRVLVAASLTGFLPAFTRFIAMPVTGSFRLLLQSLHFFQRNQFLPLHQPPPLLKQHRHRILQWMDVDDFALTVGCPHTFVFAGELLARRHVLFILVYQTAAQPPTHPGDFRWVERDSLCLRHFDRNRAEISQEGAATAQFPARAIPTQEFGDIARTNLPHLNLRPKDAAEFRPQLARIDSIFGCIDKSQHTAIVIVLRGHKLNLFVAAQLISLLLTYPQRLVLLCFPVLFESQIARGRRPQDGSIVSLYILLRLDKSHHLPHLPSASRLHNDVITRL